MSFRTKKRSTIAVLAIASMAAVALLAFTVSGAAQSPQSSKSKIRFVRTSVIKGGETGDLPATDFDVAQGPSVDSNFPKPQLSGTVQFARVPADHVPTAAGNEIVSGSFFSFLGLTHRDQRLSGTGIYTNTQFNIEPPDQGLAVGNGFVVEPVNDVLAVYSAADGSLLSGPEPLNQFFGLPPAIVRATATTPNVFGPDLSDPRAYFDSSTGHFFITETEIGRDPNTGALMSPAQLFIAVSQTNDPTGSWNVFTLDITNDGDSVFGSCPCFGDQPLIGADQTGFYISTNASRLVHRVSVARNSTPFPRARSLSGRHPLSPRFVSTTSSSASASSRPQCRREALLRRAMAARSISSALLTSPGRSPTSSLSGP